MKIYTIRDVAQEAGVSVTTVSRVLNGRPDVSRETRERVHAIIAAHNFVGNANARSLKQQDEIVAALILRGRSNPFLSGLGEAMIHYAAESPVSMLLEAIDEKADEYQTALRLMHEKRAKGFVFLGSRLDERADALRSAEVPVVFATVDATQAGFTNCSSVFIDERAMGYQAVETLLQAGHRRIAVFGGDRTVGDGLAARFQGAKDAFDDAGIPFDESRYVDTRFSLSGAYDAARAFFSLHADTTAVFAMSDIVAMGVIRALKDLGRRVPEDVSVVGFDGIEMGKYFIPSLTTVAQPADEIARKSVEALLDMMLEGGDGRQIKLDAKLVTRESVKPPKK